MTASAQIKPAGSINHVGIRYLSPEGANNIEIYDDPDIGGTANLLMTINVTNGAVNFEGPIGIYGELDSFGAGTSFSPTLSASGSMTASSATSGSCRYWQLGKLVFASYYFTDITLGGTASSDIRATLPVNAEHLSYGNGGIVTESTLVSGLVIPFSATVVGFRKGDVSNFTLGTNRGMRAFLMYQAAA